MAFPYAHLLQKKKKKNKDTSTVAKTAGKILALLKLGRQLQDNN